MKVRNISLHKARMQAANRMLPTQLGRDLVPPGKPIFKLLPVCSLPQWIYRSDRVPSWEIPAAPLSHASTWSRFPCLCQPMGAEPIYATPDLGTWGPSNWAKGHGQKLAEHRGYFGQGSSH